MKRWWYLIAIFIVFDCDADTVIGAEKHYTIDNFVASPVGLLKQAHNKERAKTVKKIVASLEKKSTACERNKRQFDVASHGTVSPTKRDYADLAAQRVSLVVREATLKELCTLLSLSTGIRFVVDPTIEHTIHSCAVDNISLATVMDMLLSNHTPALALCKEHDVWRVMLKEQEVALRLAQSAHERTNALMHESKIMCNVRWNDVFKKRIEDLWNVMAASNPADSYFFCDDHSKTVFFKATSDITHAFKQRLDAIDCVVPQVKIEARIVLASKDFEQSIGFDWSGIYDRRASVNHVDFAGVGIGEVNSSDPTSFEDLLTWTVNFIPSGLSAAANKLKIPLIFGNRNLDTKRLNLLLNAAENNNEIKTILQPQLLVNSGDKAELLVGQEMPHQIKMEEALQGAVTNALTTSYKDVGIKMQVQPDVAPDLQEVELDIFVENSRVVRPHGVLGMPSARSSRGDYDYVIDTARSKNKVRLKNGQTTQISGLLVNVEEYYQTGVPVLCQIPFLGALFRGQRKMTVDKQIIIYITPTLVV